MRQGLTKEDAIAEYGGAENVSGGAQKILHYVYLYQSTRSMSRERITALATSQCESGSFGDVSCEALPTPYIQAGGGCEGSFSAARAAPHVDLHALYLARSDKRQQAAAELLSKQNAMLIARAEKEKRISKCQTNIQRKINGIDAQIQSGLPSNGQGVQQRRLREIEQMSGRPRSGADPNGKRLELRRLRKSLTVCR